MTHAASIFNPFGLISLASCLLCTSAFAVDRTWTGAAFDQNFQTPTNWSPSGVPIDGDNATIATGSASAFLSLATHVDNLTLLDGAELRTNARALLVDDRVTLQKTTLAPVRLTLESGLAGVDLASNFCDVLDGAELILSVDSQLQIARSMLIDTDSRLSGSGTVELTGGVLDRLRNNGTIDAIDLVLTRSLSSAALIDLDGGLENALVNVTGSMNVLTPLAEAFNGTFSAAASSTISFSGDFELGAGGLAVPKGTLVLSGGPSATPTTFDATNLTLGGNVAVDAPVAGAVVHLVADTVLTAPGVIVGIGNAATLRVANMPLFTGGQLNVGNAARLEVDSNWSLVDATLHVGSGATVGRSPSATSALTVNEVTGNSLLSGEGHIEVNATVQNGELSPGLTAADAGTFTFDQNLSFLGGTYLCELGGSSTFDRILVGGAATLGGDLSVSLIGGFVPSSGDTFDVLRFASRTGTLQASGLVYGPGAEDFLQPVYRADHLVLYSPLIGDANFDGTVSGADFTLWADNFGTGDDWSEADFNGDNAVTGGDYTLWADHFGQMVTLDVTAVPEPSAWVMAITAVLAQLAAWRVRRPRGNPLTIRAGH